MKWSGTVGQGTWNDHIKMEGIYDPTEMSGRGFTAERWSLQSDSKEKLYLNNQEGISLFLSILGPAFVEELELAIFLYMRA